MRFVMLLVKFENGLFIPVLKNEATRLKNFQLEIEKFLKKSNVRKARLRLRTVFHTPPFSNSGVQPVKTWR
jgi:hypothetical protein